jgi:CubicO group peptidase (beta-lactamase class C family)
MLPRLNEIFREIIDLITTMVSKFLQIQQNWARYLAVAVIIRPFVEHFMTVHVVPGVSVAIAYKGRLVFAKGYGYADTSTNEPVTTKHLFRIASLSKPITAAAIFTLLEKRRYPQEVGERWVPHGWVPVLSLNEKVFGQGGILGTTYGTPPPNSKVDQITVRHLLEHTSGWNQNGQPGNPPDPMFDSSHINDTQDQLISFMVQQPIVDPAPGTHYRYLNIGYLILGRVIEARSGMPYADYVQQAVLTPCGIQDMHIAGNTLADRRPNEVHYYPGPSSPYNPYALLVDRMDAHGGWIACPTDLLRFLVRVDRFAPPPDILSSPSTLTMVTPTTATKPPPATPPNNVANYAKGWGVHTTVAAGQDNYWHEGNIAGTEAFFVRTTDQYCVAILANSRDDSTQANLDQMMFDIDKLWWNIKEAVEGKPPQPDLAWPTGSPL